MHIITFTENNFATQILFSSTHQETVSPKSQVAGTSDSWSRGHRFESHPLCCQVWPGQVAHVILFTQAVQFNLYWQKDGYAL